MDSVIHVNDELEIVNQVQFSTAHESEIDKNRKDLDEVLGRIREHSVIILVIIFNFIYNYIIF